MFASSELSIIRTRFVDFFAVSIWWWHITSAKFNMRRPPQTNIRSISTTYIIYCGFDLQIIAVRSLNLPTLCYLFTALIALWGWRKAFPMFFPVLPPVWTFSDLTSHSYTFRLYVILSGIISVGFIWATSKSVLAHFTTALYVFHHLVNEPVHQHLFRVRVPFPPLTNRNIFGLF